MHLIDARQIADDERKIEERRLDTGMRAFTLLEQERPDTRFLLPHPKSNWREEQLADQGRTAQKSLITRIEMIPITKIAETFFQACEAGKGWQVCSAYCTPDATFSAQASALNEVKTLAQYTEWMKGIFAVLPDARYDLKSFATDEVRKNVVAFAVFHATHTGEGGPVPPTGRRMSTDYVYVMQFEGDKIAHMTKIWNDELALKQVGWA